MGLTFVIDVDGIFNNLNLLQNPLKRVIILDKIIKSNVFRRFLKCIWPYWNILR